MHQEVCKAHEMASEDECEDSVLCHLSDGKAWIHFNNKYPDSAAEPRNVRLSLCVDGFNPYILSSRSCSIWHVVDTPNNFPPEMCMTKPFIFLTSVIYSLKIPRTK